MTLLVDLYCQGYAGCGPGFNRVRNVFLPLAIRTQPDFKASRVTFKAIVLPFVAIILHSQLAVILLGSCEIIRPLVSCSVHPQLHGGTFFSAKKQHFIKQNHLDMMCFWQKLVKQQELLRERLGPQVYQHFSFLKKTVSDCR